jgi:hypothetical protein
MSLVYKIQQKREIEHEIHNEYRKFAISSPHDRLAYYADNYFERITKRQLFSIIYSLQYVYNSIFSAPKFPEIVKQSPETLAFPTSWG